MERDFGGGDGALPDELHLRETNDIIGERRRLVKCFLRIFTRKMAGVSSERLRERLAWSGRWGIWVIIHCKCWKGLFGAFPILRFDRYFVPRLQIRFPIEGLLAIEKLVYRFDGYTCIFPCFQSFYNIFHKYSLIIQIKKWNTEDHCSIQQKNKHPF